MLTRRRLLLALAALPAACSGDETFARFESSGPVARPGGRGLAQPVSLSYQVRRPATVAATVRSPAGEWPLRPPALRAPGEEYQLAFDGTVPVGSAGDREVLPDGRYEIALRAVEAEGRVDERRASLRIEGATPERLDVEGPTLSLATISPDGDGVDDEVRIAFRITRPAAVELVAADARGNRAPIIATARRPPGEQAAIWDGSSGGRVFGGKRLPDGDYSIVLTARDDAGNVRVRQAPLRIANGGIERLEIAEATIGPDRLRVGDELRIRIKVVNSGETVVRTMGPPPATTYRLSESFSLALDQTGRPYPIVSGAWRVGLGWRGADQELPLRWGLLASPGATLPPGAEAIVEAGVTIDRRPDGAAEGVRFWVGAIREGVGMSGGRLGDRLVRIDR